MTQEDRPVMELAQLQPSQKSATPKTFDTHKPHLSDTPSTERSWQRDRHTSRHTGETTRSRHTSSDLKLEQYNDVGHRNGRSSTNLGLSRRVSVLSYGAGSEGIDAGQMSQAISQRATLLRWFDAPDVKFAAQGHSPTCVAIKGTESEYIFEPANVHPALSKSILALDESAVLTMSSQITSGVIGMLNPQQKSLVVDQNGHRLPILPSLDEVTSAISYSARACIVRKEQLVLVWSDSPETILDVSHDVEKQLLNILSGNGTFSTAVTPRNGWSRATSIYSADGKQTMSDISETAPVRGALNEKSDVYIKAAALEERTEEDEDLEAALPPRPMARVHSIKISLAIMLVILTQFLGVSKLVNEYSWDGGYLRFLIMLAIPPLTAFSLFFFIVLVASVFQLFLPLGNCLKNTKYHSAIRPKHGRHRDYELPHITIQMPVYKEGLRGVIVPTIISVMAAIQHYEEQGGTASVFINDDGMQAIEPELAEARKQYYFENDIGYTARLPNHKSQSSKQGLFKKLFGKKSNPEAEQKSEQVDDGLSPSQSLANKLGFMRKGKFKKASNMNYGLAFSARVEEEFERLTKLTIDTRGITEDDLTVGDDDELYQQALDNMLAADDGKTWAAGNIRIGELILIIDCDTQVPVDCLLYGALEMHESPEVAILQHGSGVMQVVHNTFENGISYFTNIVYTAIKYGVGTGDVAPFVGHNAFLRWKSLQSIAFVDSSDGQTKWWSDAHVSEDFDISLRLQMQGMVVRLATYHDGGFKEGVSLTVYDELTRWEKYAYGCNELVFNPFSQWVFKGPVTGLFMKFLFSNIPVTSKVTIIAYISTYYAIGSGMLLATVNYIVIGLFHDDVDHDYLPSWGIWISLVVVFNGFASVAFSMLRHQMKEATFWRALVEAVKWLPFLILFFGGISLNCAKALLCHALGINIEWASTAKEMGPTGFYIGLDKMVHSFKYTWGICILLSGVMIYFAVGAPWGWTIAPEPHSDATLAIVPLAIQLVSAFFLPLGLGMN
ncbi:hypothetical protein ACEPPN_005219 [Leptodophora sp. 'Broadleaf-Isolate-01']